MLDVNEVRAMFATYLADHASHRHSLDAALMHVVEVAYQRGMADAPRCPADDVTPWGESLQRRPE